MEKFCRNQEKTNRRKELKEDRGKETDETKTKITKAEEERVSERAKHRNRRQKAGLGRFVRRSGYELEARRIVKEEASSPAKSAKRVVIKAGINKACSAG